MSKIGFRLAGLCLGLSCLLLGLVECGGKGDSRTPEAQAGAGAVSSSGASGIAGGGKSGRGGDSAGVAGTLPGACVAPTADGYEPMWMPPIATPGACTEQQISQMYAVCEGSSGTYDRNACRTFETDAANSTCLGCMFSARGSQASGAILVLQDGYWIANVGGCEALIDGDSSPTGCGARTQAAGVCQYGACVDACTAPTPDAEWNACLGAARVACADYGKDAACAGLPRYAICQYPTFSEFFSAFGKLFCVSGPPASVGEGGAAGAAGASP
jgi:hypothetical protein